MRQSKKEFFSTGVVNQKTPDIIVDLKRVGDKYVQNWTRKEKDIAIEFMATTENQFKAFKKELLRLLK